jgi:hypothetical protein
VEPEEHDGQYQTDKDDHLGPQRISYHFPLLRLGYPISLGITPLLHTHITEPIFEVSSILQAALVVARAGACPHQGEVATGLDEGANDLGPATVPVYLEAGFHALTVGPTEVMLRTHVPSLWVTERLVEVQEVQHSLDVVSGVVVHADSHSNRV